MARIKITAKDAYLFPGGWSLKPDEMYLALRSVTYQKQFNLLEFGAGAGTGAMVTLLKKLKIPYRYVSYENNTAYVCADKTVETVFWKDFPTVLVPGIFDLIIIDGPQGKIRCDWYPLLKGHTRSGTILVVDDYRHFPQFETVLNANMSHTIIKEFGPELTRTKKMLTWLVTRIN